MKKIFKTNLYGLGILLIFLFGSYAVSSVLTSFFNVNNLLIKQLIIPYVTLLLPSLLYLLFTKQNIRTSLKLKLIDPLDVILIILISFTIQPLMMLINLFSSLIFGNHLNGFLAEVVNQPFLLLALAIAVTPAICEEVVTRGVFLSGYENTGVKTVYVALLNGLFFGILHMNFQQFFYAFLLGFIFVYLVKATNSLFASILAHFTINFSQVALLKISSYLINTHTNQDITNLMTANTQVDVITFIVPIALTIIFTPLALFFIYILLKKHNQLDLIKKHAAYSSSTCDNSPQYKSTIIDYLPILVCFIFMIVLNLHS